MSMTLPFASLRAFEAVVRLRGFGRAAEELGVTQSAISQHVKSLEDWTGCALLIRGPRETRATAQGKRLSDAVRQGLGQIEQVCEALKSDARHRRTLVISSPPGFAINWLFPRLLRFDQEHPDIPVSIATQTAQPDLSGPEIDAAIHYGAGGYSGLDSHHLMHERVFPVCHPDLMAQMHDPCDMSDLARFTLLVDDLSEPKGTPPTWEFWAQKAALCLPADMRRRRFGQSNLVIQAAVQGLGVALGREPLVIDILQTGGLVRPFPQIAMSDYSYWLVAPKHKTTPPALAAFRDWLIAEAQSQPDLPPRQNERSLPDVRMD